MASSPTRGMEFDRLAVGVEAQRAVAELDAVGDFQIRLVGVRFVATWPVSAPSADGESAERSGARRPRLAGERRAIRRQQEERQARQAFRSISAFFRRRFAETAVAGTRLLTSIQPASAFFMARKSRQANRFCNGLRSKKAGWKVGMARISRAPVSKVNQRPRVLVMPSLMPSSACADGPPRQTNMSGSTKLDLAQDEGQAGLLLLRRRRAVAGRAPGHDVGDVDRRAVEADGRQHAVEQFAGAADEGQALDVLVAAGRFADEHHARFGLPSAKTSWVAVAFSAQPSKRSSVARKLIERLGALGGLARRQRGFVGGAKAAARRPPCGGGPRGAVVSRSRGTHAAELRSRRAPLQAAVWAARRPQSGRPAVRR